MVILVSPQRNIVAIIATAAALELPGIVVVTPVLERMLYAHVIFTDQAFLYPDVPAPQTHREHWHDMLHGGHRETTGSSLSDAPLVL